MNRNKEQPIPATRNPAYRRAFQRLNEALERESDFSNAEIIAEMRKTYFASVDDLERSGKVKLPD